jgi:hypothetical protein
MAVSGSESWAATRIAANEKDVLFVIANSVVKRAEGTQLVPVACTNPAAALSASEAGVYVVGVDGRLQLANGTECRDIAVPGKVTSVASFDQSLAVVSEGIVYRRKSGAWREVAQPVRYREDARTRSKVSDVSMSKNTLWARDTEGFVFMLSELP